MDLKNNLITLKELLDHPAAKELLEKHFAQVLNNPMLKAAAKNMSLEKILSLADKYVNPQELQEVLEKLKSL